MKELSSFADYAYKVSELRQLSGFESNRLPIILSKKEKK
jgi:hypothetical protein